MNENIYRCISAYSFRGNYSFLNLNLCTVTKGTVHTGVEIFQGRKFTEIRYRLGAFIFSFFLLMVPKIEMCLKYFWTKNSKSSHCEYVIIICWVILLVAWVTLIGKCVIFVYIYNGCFGGYLSKKYLTQISIFGTNE